MKGLQSSVDNCLGNVSVKPVASLSSIDITSDMFFDQNASDVYQQEVESVRKAYAEDVLSTTPVKKKGRTKKEKLCAWVEEYKKKVYPKGYKPKKSVPSFTIAPYDDFGDHLPQPEGIRMCTSCEIPKPFKDFRTVKGYKRLDGTMSPSKLDSTCKECAAKKTYLWKNDPKNAEKVAKQKADYPEYRANWAANNKDKLKQYYKKARIKHKDKINLRAKKILC